MYALTNKLSRLPLQMQETIERMFILKQIHICDRIVHLMNNKRREEADKLMKDLSSFDCEEFDEVLPKIFSFIITHLFLISKV